jgi:DNA-binding MarR family transcriptional regulator
MQSLQTASRRSARETADALLQAVPEVMYFLRGSYRAQSKTRLTVAQIRTLVIVSRRPNGALSDIAELLGISLPAASRVVAAMVARKLIQRSASSRDRRTISLVLTAAGRKSLEQAIEIGREAVAQRLLQLSEKDQLTVRTAMQHLDAIFGEPA